VSGACGVFVGLATLDCVHRVDRLPGPDEKVTAIAQDLAAGGPAAGAAVTFAALGGEATLVTALGRHPLARAVADELAGRGVRVLDATPARQEPPAVSGVRVEAATGRRSVASVDATGVAAAPPVGLEGLVDTAQVVLLDGHHPDLALAAAQAARAYGRPVVLDGGSWKPVLTRLLPLVDVAVCSAVFRVPGARSSEASLDALRGAGVPVVAVTRGAQPVLWAVGACRGETAVPAVRAVDTLGAGDVLHGALAYALAYALPWSGPGGVSRPGAFDPQTVAEALSFAAEVAALRCRHPGPRAWLDDPALAVLARRPLGVHT